MAHHLTVISQTILSPAPRLHPQLSYFLLLSPKETTANLLCFGGGWYTNVPGVLQKREETGCEGPFNYMTEV